MAAPTPRNHAHLLPPTYKQTIATWLSEDCPSFDYGGYVVGDTLTKAKLYGKSPGILAGVPFFDEVFHQLGCTVTWHHPETTPIHPPNHHLATVQGPAHSLLLGERTALNILSRCSGIATASTSLLATVRSANYPNILAGTRKTTPGFRLFEKYAMLVAGIDTHRMDLSQMVMLKDNHVVAAGGVGRAVERVREVAGFGVKVEVEVRDQGEAVEAVEAGADVVMLDNFTGEGVRECAGMLRRRFGGGGGGGGGNKGGRKFLIEVSGGLTGGNVAEVLCEEVDVVSSSGCHQGVKHVDFSLKVVGREGEAGGG